ncbi:MAG: PAS domain-containing protein [Hydrogenophaga sp.]|uniref:sensor histidine kinase n=1 Tax=Hydrogenophaga sp. TaxID=1904254 RepID=UPI0026198033|nr:PAS domain-containing sensor histidine kinase [Hydrogenophaga sp.]MCW5671549.1 PAS domain-containing protein [Hydrogenophaga sp.]
MPTLEPSASPSSQAAEEASCALTIERLQAQAALTRSIADRLPWQLAYFDPDLRCRFGNQAFCDGLGVDPSALEGRPFQDCFPQEALPALLPRFMQALAGEQQLRRTEHPASGPGAACTETAFTPDVHDGVIRGVFVETKEVAQRQQADELAQNKRRFELMADALQDSCLYFLDPAGRIAEWSESARRLHGFSREQVGNMHLADMAAPRVGEEAEIGIDDTIRLAIDRGQWETRGWLRRAGGEAFWGQTLITALRGDDGELEGLSCITRDMTAMKDLDRVMNDLNAELDRRVTQRVRQHTVPNKDLDIFTHSITHDLRGPVRHINTFAGLIAEELGENASEEVRHFRDAMKRASQRLNAMIENLLTYSRIGRIDLHPERLAMAQVLDGVIARLQQTDPGRPIRWEIQPELPAVVADAAMVTDLFTRLLDNAMKFTRKVEPAEIQIGCRMESDGTCLFFIVDNGVGFDVAKASNLFLMFQRQHHSLDFEGHGAGLALCQRIVQRHNGRIWLDSTPGHGCAVYFTLPVETTMAGAGLAALGC